MVASNTRTTNKKRYQWLAVCIILLGLIILASLCIGAKPLALSTIYNVMFNGQQGLASTIIFEGRLPIPVINEDA